MLQEGLEHDQIQWIKCVIKHQLDNRKFIHEPMTIVLKNYRKSREKKHVVDRR